MERAAQKVDYNHRKTGDLMKNERMVPPVTRFENSSKASKPFCHVWLPPLHNMPLKICSSFAQMGNLHSRVNLGQYLMTQRSKPSTQPSTGCSEQQVNVSVVCLQEEAQTDTHSPAPQTRLLAEAQHHAMLTLPDQGCPGFNQLRTGSRKWGCLRMP